MRLIIKMGTDQYRENLFTVDKVVVIISYKVEVASYRDIVLVERAEDGTLQAFFNIYAHHC